MRRSFARLCFAAALSVSFSSTMLEENAFGQSTLASVRPSMGSPELKKLNVPPATARSIATKLSIRYRDVPGVTIQHDTKNQQLVVMATAAQQAQIASDVRTLIQSGIRQAAAKFDGPLQIQLTQVTWREFEDRLQSVVPAGTPITTSRNGERAAFQLTSAPLNGTTVEVDRRGNQVTVIAPEPSMEGWQKMIKAIDGRPARPGDVLELVRLQNAEPAPIQRAIRLLREIEQSDSEAFSARSVNRKSPFRNAVFQAPAGQDAGRDGAAGPNQSTDEDQDAQGVAGDTELQFIPELGMIIIKGSKKDVERVKAIIGEIEQQSELTRPDVEVKRLQYADSNAVAQLLEQLYEDVLSTRQGEVSITALDSPNALLLIGRKEAIASVMDLISKIDMPIEDDDRLRVFRLQHTSATDAEETIQQFFTEQPGASDDQRPGLGTRVRVLADYRTNSLIVSAAPRDLNEVTRLINELDVQQIKAQSEIRTFTLNNALAEDLAETLNAVITPATTDEAAAPSTTFTIVRLGENGSEQLDSGILTGAVITADANANAIVVKAPAASMPLLEELILQLDRAPGIESLVKVFTLENSDATQLTTALETLFGSDAGTTGTSVGAGNLSGLATSTASDSALTPLRFSAEVRTNSIIASGSEEDLEVVESILLRLDSEGFAERITEVIWLRHQYAPDLAVAIQTYVDQRGTSQNSIQQIQQGGLSPYDLPDRDLIVVAEETTNSLIVSVAPRLYEDVRRMIDQLDRRPPMIMVKTMIAEVTLDDLFEIGGEVGLQDSLLFDRGVTDAALGAASLPGFNFNQAGLPNANQVAAGTVAARGVSTFGVGTTSTAGGVGGFVLNAASDSVNLLFRTLQQANRAQIISRPQVTTLDNTAAGVTVGRTIYQITGFLNNVNGTQLVTEPLEVGLILEVTPRVGSDGLITMDIRVERSDRIDGVGTIVPTEDGAVLIEDVAKTEAISTINAYNGQTVVFGGLIQKRRSNSTSRIPYVSNIPLLGNMFKFDRETEERSELLIVMTPLIVNGEEDLEYMKLTESSRMSWCLADVVEAHGDVGLSHGYGLWGPAVGTTIYPDVTPTIDGFQSNSSMIEGRVLEDKLIGESVISDTAIQGTGIPQGSGVSSAAPVNGTGFEGVNVVPPDAGMGSPVGPSGMTPPADGAGPVMEAPLVHPMGFRTPVENRSNAVPARPVSYRTPDSTTSTPVNGSTPIRLGGGNPNAASR